VLIFSPYISRNILGSIMVEVLLRRRKIGTRRGINSEAPLTSCPLPVFEKEICRSSYFDGGGADQRIKGSPNSGHHFS
jgi:hypothetical protein